MSPSNNADELQEKVAEYVEYGTQLVWVVYPKTRSIVVHDSTGHAQIVTAGDTLSAPALLPGLEVPIATIFA